MQSKYLAFHKALKLRVPNFLQPLGSRVLVEILPAIEMKTAGGLIVSTQSNQRTDTKENQFTAAVILDVGTGYVDEEGKTVPMSFKVGQVVQIARTNARIYSTHPMLGGQFTSGDLADVTEASIQYLIADSLEEYAQALDTVQALKAELANG